MTFRRRAGHEPGAETSGQFATEALAHLDSLYGTALRLTRKADDAEDLVQETFLKAFRAASSFERGTNLKAWLYTILHNTWRNVRRDRFRDPVEVDSEAVEAVALTAGAQVSPEQLLARESLDADLQAALDSLPENFRVAVWLRDVEELTYAEIAKALDVPIGTVMSRISRGRRALYSRLTSQPPRPTAVRVRPSGSLAIVRAHEDNSDADL